MKVICDNAKSFLEYFGNGGSSVEEVEVWLREVYIYGHPLETDKLIYVVRAISKLEHSFEKLIFSYYEVAAFISGVLLKANIYSASIILGDDYVNLIDSLLEKRSVKKLFFKPNIYKGAA